MATHSTLTDHLLQAAFRYIEKGKLVSLEAVIQEYPELVQIREEPDGWGLIHSAAKLGRTDLISVLLELGADPNMPEGKLIADEETPAVYEPGAAPLHYAVQAGHEDATNFLLSHGAVAKVADYYGETPLHAVRKPQIAEALLKAGADPNAICWMRYFDEADSSSGANTPGLTG